MGRVKEVLATLDNGAEAIITSHTLVIGKLVLTQNDIEQVRTFMQYLREVRPLETLAEITRENTIPLSDFTGE